MSCQTYHVVLLWLHCPQTCVNIDDCICREGITGDQLRVDAADILSYNAELAKYVLENPTESLPLVSYSSHQRRRHHHTVPSVALIKLVSHRAAPGHYSTLEQCHHDLKGAFPATGMLISMPRSRLERFLATGERL